MTRDIPRPVYVVWQGALVTLNTDADMRGFFDEHGAPPVLHFIHEGQLVETVLCHGEVARTDDLITGAAFYLFPDGLIWIVTQAQVPNDGTAHSVQLGVYTDGRSLDWTSQPADVQET